MAFARMMIMMEGEEEGDHEDFCKATACLSTKGVKYRSKNVTRTQRIIRIKVTWTPQKRFILRWVQYKDVVKQNGEKIIYRNNLGSLKLALIMNSRLLFFVVVVVVVCLFVFCGCVRACADARVCVCFVCVRVIVRGARGRMYTYSL